MALTSYLLRASGTVFILSTYRNVTILIAVRKVDVRAISQRLNIRVSAQSTPASDVKARYVMGRLSTYYAMHGI